MKKAMQLSRYWRGLKVHGLLAVMVCWTAGSSMAVPLVGQLVGKAVASSATSEMKEAATKQVVNAGVKSAVRETSKQTAKGAAKAGVKHAMSSALRGVKPVQLLGVGSAVAIPLAAHNLTKGASEVDKAHAQTIREAGQVAIREMEGDPVLAEKTLSTLTQPSDTFSGRLSHWCSQILPWGCGLVGLICLLYLLGFLLRGYAQLRRGVAAIRSTGGDVPKSPVGQIS